MSDPADDPRQDADPADVEDDEDDELPDAEGVSDPVVTARRRHGTAGAVIAAGMFGLDVALGRKPREEAPVVVDANSEPVDIDTDGIRVDVDDRTSVVVPPQPRSDPARRTRRSRRARRAN